MGEEAGGDEPAGSRRLVVVSHACVLAVNQEVYAELVDRGWDVHLVVPDRWRHEYDADPFPPEVHPGLAGRVHPSRITDPGAVQRHVHLDPPARLLRFLDPDVVLVEEESFSVPAAQWGTSAWRLGVPFGVQAAENLDRPLPAAARLLRRWTLGRAAFTLARSPAAARLARRFGGPPISGIVPHAVPRWATDRPPGLAGRQPGGEGGAPGLLTVGYAGRLVPEKGIGDLIAAVARLPAPVRLLVAGDGPLRPDLERATLPPPGLDLRPDLGHAGMPAAYRDMDVLVLPSRTTATWAEQFGRVLVEALSFGVPVIGSDSGEIPWVVAETEGGVVVPEGDVDALTVALADVRADPEGWAARGRIGRRRVAERFSVAAAADALERLLARVRRS